jgi:hypothetical protein
MCTIPLDLERRLEQRWAARFSSAAALQKHRLPGHQVPDETRMKQFPFPCENVVKQIAGINDLEQTTGDDS